MAGENLHCARNPNNRSRGSPICTRHSAYPRKGTGSSNSRAPSTAYSSGCANASMKRTEGSIAFGSRRFSCSRRRPPFYRLSRIKNFCIGSGSWRLLQVRGEAHRLFFGIEFFFTKRLGLSGIALSSNTTDIRICQ